MIYDFFFLQYFTLVLCIFLLIIILAVNFCLFYDKTTDFFAQNVIVFRIHWNDYTTNIIIFII